jgi:putative acetyltransferase
MNLTIRPELPGDAPAIRALTEAAFRNVAHSDGSEADVVDRLRADGDLTLSLVTTNMDKAIIGHIAFSPVTISDGSEGWYGLGPCSVIPTRQRTGIGSAQVEAGLAELRARGARGVVLLGSPKYYGRFGFEHDPVLAYPDAPAEYFQRLVLVGEAPSGTVRYAPAFG